MSLVNEALRKARAEASRQETNRAETPAPGLGHGMHPPTRRSPISPGTILLLALGAIAVAVILMVARGFRTPAAEQINAAAQNEKVAEVRTEAEPALGGTASGEAVEISAAAQSSPEPTAAVPAETRQSPETSDSREADSPRRTQRLRDSELQVAEAQSPPPSTTALPRMTSATVSASESATSPQSRPQSATPTRIETEAGNAPTTATPKSTSMAGRQAATEPDAEAPPTTAAAATIQAAPAREDEDATESFVREAEIPGVGTYRLDGIAWSTDRPFALVNGQVVGPGGFVDGAAVARVEQDRVLLTRENRRFELRLR